MLLVLLSGVVNVQSKWGLVIFRCILDQEAVRMLGFGSSQTPSQISRKVIALTMSFGMILWPMSESRQACGRDYGVCRELAYVAYPEYDADT